MLKMKKLYRLDDPDDVKELQRMVMESDEECDRCEFENESDLDENESIEVRSENSDSEQDISSENGEEGTNSNEDYFLGKDKVSKWEKNIIIGNKIRRQPQNILVQLPVVKPYAKNAITESECWSCFISEEILNLILVCTNKYIDSISTKYSRERDARHVDIIELRAFLGLLYLAGMHRSNRLNLEDLWATNGSGIELFRLTMSLRRFRFIHNSIRFDDKTTRLERIKIDKLAPVREIFSLFVENCKKSYSMGQNVTIDEMLVGFRGKCGFRQYIPSKPNKYGIKIFSLVDSKLFYTGNLEIYAGKQHDGPFCVSNKPVDVVKRLAEPIYNSGRNITADNWFTDLNLVRELKQNRLSYVGTVRKNKPQLPPELVNTTNRKIKSNLFAFSKDCTVVSHIPKKGKNVILVSSMHFDNLVDPNSQKPEIIEYYNQTKSGVDTVDQMVGGYNVARNSRRWPMVIFYALLNIGGINAQIIHMLNQNVKIRRRRFIRNLSDQLLSEQIRCRADITTGIHKPLHLKLQSLQKPKEGNSSNDPDPDIQLVGNKRKRCSSCYASKTTRLSKYYCKCCKTFLCLEHSTIICYSCYSSFTNPPTDDSD